MILLNKLGQRNVNNNIKDNILPSITEQINKPSASRLTNTPINQRLSSMNQRGQIGSMPEWGKVQKRFIADLPANVQLNGIQEILSGQDTPSPIINNFVRGMAAQGKSPEEIRTAFIEQQKRSDNPLVLM